MTIDNEAASAAAPVCGLAPMHPGELLREEIMPEIKITKVDLAGRLGVSRVTLDNLLKERQQVTAPMALRLGKLFGNSAEFWMNLQTRFDLARERERMAAEIATIPTLEAAH